MQAHPLHKIVICGNGLAAHMCAVALQKTVPGNVEITLVKPPETVDTDTLYGNVTSPTTYEFLRKIDISEPELLLKSNTTFSLGTKYVNWALSGKNWTQSFHAPLPLFEGVGFHHYISRRHKSLTSTASLEPYIMSVQAANKGVFAHPPEDRRTPLAAMEYGYHFLPDDWINIFTGHLEKGRVEILRSDIIGVKKDHGRITSVSLANGQEVSADFFIDCTGVETVFSSENDLGWKPTQDLKCITHFEKGEKLEGVCRNLEAKDYGWKSSTPLRNGVMTQTIYHPDSENSALDPHDKKTSRFTSIQFGRCDTPWQSNCLKIGHGAAALEPLTPAPLMLLQSDIDRLIELLPVSHNMEIEAREYNRRFSDDYFNADLFQNTFFALGTLPDTPYWQAKAILPQTEKLSAKIEQFKNRGVLVQYDYEPFLQQDWAMLYFGLGCIPERYDPLAERIAEERIDNTLAQMRMAISQMADKMPSHEVYMSGLLKYLKEQNG